MTQALSGRSRAGDRARPVRCQICKAVTVPGVDLGHQPVSDLILTRAQLNRPETFYPMQLHHCPRLRADAARLHREPEGRLQELPVRERDDADGDASTCRASRACSWRSARSGSDSFAVDIGSNDGTLLKGFAPSGVRFLGIDPSGDPVRIANEQGIPTLHDFFTEESARRIRDEHGAADAISAAGVFGHIADLASVMRGVDALLAPEGVFLTENQYWLDMVERLHYDNMFHQHLRYYSMRPLLRLYADYGLEIFDVRRSEVYGGSITVLAGRPGKHPRVAASRQSCSRRRRRRASTTSPRGSGSRARSRIARRALFDAVHGRVQAGEKVVGIGAPAKASTVCNYCRLGPELVDYVTEINPLRIGMFLPGVHIPIVDEELLFSDPKPRRRRRSSSPGTTRTRSCRSSASAASRAS